MGIEDERWNETSDTYMVKYKCPSQRNVDLVSSDFILVVWYNAKQQLRSRLQHARQGTTRHGR